MMRLVFNSISLKNYKSFGNIETKFNLDTPGCVLIIGENLDFTSEGKTSNGTGKTSAFEAICYALYDKTPSNISKDNLINNINKKNMEVILKFTKDNNEYSIKRERKGPKGNTIELLKNGSDITLDSVGRNNDLIQEIIGIPFELFVQIITISASNTTPYFNLPLRSGNSPSQVGLIEELFNLKSLTEKADVLKELMKETKTRLEFKQQKFELLKTEKERHDHQVLSAKRRIDDWIIETGLSISKNQVKLDEYLEINFEEQKSIFKELTSDQGILKDLNIERHSLEDIINREIKTRKKIDDWNKENTQLIKKCQDTLDEYAGMNFDEQKVVFQELITDKGLIRNLIREKSSLKDTIDRETKTKTKRSLELEHLEEDTCPFCLQRMPDANEKDSMEKIDGLKNTIRELDNNINQSNKRLSEIELETNELNIKISLLEKLVTFDNIEELTCCQTLMSSTKIKLDELKNSENPYIETFEEINNIEEVNFRLDTIETKEANFKVKINLLKKSVNFDNIEELMRCQTNLELLTAKISELKKSKNPHLESLGELENIVLEHLNHSELNDLSERYEHQKFLLKLLTKKDSFVRKNLLNKNIPFLNTRLAHNLKEFGLPHHVQFTHELTADITQFGNTLDFGNLSHGQQARVNLALSFAFRDVLLNLHGFINILVLDEILDSGLDNVGIYSAVNMIKKKTHDEKLSTFVISHKDEISTLFHGKLKIQMENSFSQIINQ